MDKSSFALGLIITILALINIYMYYQLNKLKDRVKNLENNQKVLQEGLLDALDIIIKLKESLGSYFEFISGAFQGAQELFDKAAQSVSKSESELEAEDAVPWE